MKTSFTEQRTTIINEVLDLINESSFETLTLRNLKFVSGPDTAGLILNEDETCEIPNGLAQNKTNLTNRIIKLLHDKSLFDSFLNKQQVFANYLNFCETYFWKSMEKQNLLQMVNIVCFI